MRIVFFIGNGFDLNLGIPTGYQNFYDFYLKQSSDSEAVTKLKSFLEKERFTKWADLEVGLGNYTSSVESIEEIRIVYYDLSDKLQEYLKECSAKFAVTDEMAAAIVMGLSTTHTFLPQGMAEAISYYKRGHYPDTIDVLSFNYTDTLERILKLKNDVGYPIKLSANASLTSINHIHMRLEDEDVIMGVNDDSQISGKEILTDELRAILVKPFINRQLQNLIDQRCLNLIDSAELVCLFGVSLGETDLLWWRRLGERFFNTNLRILLFTYDSKRITRNSERITKYAKDKDLLFNRMGISKPTDAQLNRVFVGYKTDLFQMK